MNLLPKLQEYVMDFHDNSTQISDKRKVILQELVTYILGAQSPKLNFICTHNSRRSHLTQIWAQTAAAVNGLELETFSGGTEATAFNPNAVAALKRAGFEIESDGGNNPKYIVKYAVEAAPIICFSKKFDDESNPQSAFAAVMTCSEADAECPVIFGADVRIKLLYEDPKVSDGTAQEQATYDERCRQIASEMFYVFSQIKEG